ncbi:MAG: PfkB family carbohydrate kinase [Acidobacteriota bacterium]|nr:PfkB family carbohydrate kinase [Acidobacteriota bacterium]
MVGVGANSVDHVYRLPAAPRADSATAKLRITSHSVSCGGQMATALAACAALGLRPAYVGAVGSDDHGGLVRRELAGRGIDLTHLVTREAANQFAVITVDERTGERIVLWDRDDRLMLQAVELPEALIASARLVHVDDVDEESAIRAATLARAAGVPATSDLDRVTNRTAELVAAVSIPIFAEHVVPAITGEAEYERGLRKLRQTHAGMLCLTLGPRGSMMLVDDRLYVEPGFAVQAVDTTGAGDVFRAGFIHALLSGAEPSAILRFANAAAAVSCTRVGALNSVPSLAEVERFLGRQT